MHVSAGFVGKPNVGKSTLFNAITKCSVPAENYPFCTIEPHEAMAIVPDERLNQLKLIYNSKKIIPCTVRFFDIAGLVKGAASGEGLGNKFLSHIREVNLIIHVIRCFDDENIINTDTKIDPLSDYEIIMTELAIKDIESIEKKKIKLTALSKSKQNNIAEKNEIDNELKQLELLIEALNNVDYESAKKIAGNIKNNDFLTTKEFFIVANISENDVNIPDNKYVKLLKQKFGDEKVIPIAVKLENELATLSEADANSMSDMLGLKQRALPLIIQKAYNLLGLMTFFTCGPQEIHAWTIENETTVRQAAGKIHSDFERKFICADVYNYNDIILHKTEAKLKDLGKMRTEGQDYIVQNGDIINIKFNI